MTTYEREYLARAIQERLTLLPLDDDGGLAEADVILERILSGLLDAAALFSFIGEALPALRLLDDRIGEFPDSSEAVACAGIKAVLLILDNTFVYGEGEPE